MEEYRSLYRKYRPQAPSEVLGQDHVVRALAGAVREGRLAHAFLFSGPRGTGKTSTARILAKMVNCERGPTDSPCGVCEQCVRIRDGSHLDVIEIDAASHGGVDDARELRERAPTAPAQGREKVYIIDEAQRLSREAFDALLKVFEEPPPGVRFVLATTEPHKMPATIAGRCQRFEFRRVPQEVVAGQLTDVASREGIELAAGAAEAIARDTDGSVRDALSLLDQAAVLGGDSVTVEVVRSLVGEPEMDVQFALADAIAVGDAKEVFGTVHRLVQEGHDLRHLLAQVTGHFRNLLLALSSPDDPAIVDVPQELHPRLAAQSGKFSPAELDRILGLLLQAQTDMRWTTSPRLTMELALVRAAMPETDPQPSALNARLERLERLAGIHEGAGVAGTAKAPEGRQLAPQPLVAEALSGGARQSPSSASAVPGTHSSADAPDSSDARTGAPVDTDQEEAAPAKKPEAPQPAAPAGEDGISTAAVDAQMLRAGWPQLVEELKARRKMVLAANAEIATVGSYEDDTLELVFPPGRQFASKNLDQKQQELREVVQQMFGIQPRFRFTVRQGTAAESLEPDLEADAGPETAEEAAEKFVSQLGATKVDGE